METGSMDTVIFSSILHELYSYIERDGIRFNPQTVEAALQSAYRVLAPGGRIIIRDGIMTEPVEQRRRIRFLEPDGMEWLMRYAQDFAGRHIEIERVGEHEAVLPVNDAMEFLYTYTWGRKPMYMKCRSNLVILPRHSMKSVSVTHLDHKRLSG